MWGGGGGGVLTGAPHLENLMGTSIQVKASGLRACLNLHPWSLSVYNKSSGISCCLNNGPLMAVLGSCCKLYMQTPKLRVHSAPGAKISAAGCTFLDMCARCAHVFHSIIIAMCQRSA